MPIQDPCHLTTAFANYSPNPFRLLVENSGDGILLAGPAGEVIYANHAAYRIAGFAPGDRKAKLGFEFVHPDDQADVRHLLEEVLRAPGVPFLSENRIRHRDGLYRQVEFTLTNRLDEPALRALVASFRDVTAARQAEQLRREAKETPGKLPAILETSHDALIGEDRDGNIIGWNPGAERLFGYRAEEVMGRNSSLLIPPGAAAERQPLQERVWAGERPPPFETLRRRSDGSVIDVAVSLSPVRDRAGRVVAVSEIAQDISDRKRVERELAHDRRMLEQLIGTTSDLVYVCDLTEARNVFVSARVQSILGYSPEQIAAFGSALGATLIHPDDLPSVPKGNRQLDQLADGEVYDRELRMRHADGSYRWLHCRESVFEWDANRRATKIIGTAQDVTERKQAKAELHLRERAIRAVASGVLITDPHRPDNPIIFASPGFERMTGYAPGEVVGRNCRFLQGKDTDPNVVAQVREAVRAGQPCEVEVQNYRKDGTAFWNQLSISPVHDRAGRLTHFIGVQTDVTERRSLELQFRQAQKMEAVGQLAGGVAHDFNNLLTVINGYTDLLLLGLRRDDPNRELLAEVRKAGERAATLTKQLLVFSRQSVLEPKVVDLNAVVADTEKMLGRLIGADVRLTTSLTPGLRPVEVDPGQLQQALLNLAVNARDAMPQGGRLTVETRDVELTEEQCRAIPDGRPGRYALLAVTDTGTGMDEATRSRVFEPFFTTKEPGKGTGLGLAMVHGFVKSSGGHISVSSEPGRGTTFETYLPQVSRPLSGQASPGVAAAPRGQETVLLVEDDDGVRALTRHVLQRSGYTVLEATDGLMALRVVERHLRPIHLLVADVVMPYLSGRKVAEQVKALKPGIKVLYCSGYSADAVVRHGVAEAGAAFVQKPYSPALLAQKVRDVLDGKT